MIEGNIAMSKKILCPTDGSDHAAVGLAQAIELAKQSGAPLKIVWDGNLYQFDEWAIPKGTPNLDEAYKFIKFAMQPEQQKLYTEQMAYGPSNTKAAQRNDVNWMGSFCGAMAQSPSDSSAGEMAAGDLETARQFGERVASAAARWAMAWPMAP